MKMKSVARGEKMTTQLMLAARELLGRKYDAAAKDPKSRGVESDFTKAAAHAREGKLDFYATGPNAEIAATKRPAPVLVNGRPIARDDWK